MRIPFQVSASRCTEVDSSLALHQEAVWEQSQTHSERLPQQGKAQQSALRTGIDQILKTCLQDDRQRLQEAQKSIRNAEAKGRRQKKESTRQAASKQIPARPKKGAEASASAKAKKTDEGAAGDSQTEESKPSGKDGKDEEMGDRSPSLEESQPDPDKAPKE